MFNSRTCQLILGAGALQLVGLKTITTKNLGMQKKKHQRSAIHWAYEYLLVQCKNLNLQKRDGKMVVLSLLKSPKGPRRVVTK